MIDRRGRVGRWDTAWCVVVLTASLITLAGCGTTTNWDSQGEWAAHLSVPDSLARDAYSYAYVPPGGTVDERIRLCGSHDVGFGFPFSTQSGTLSTVTAHLARPLCRLGTTEITGGTVSTYRPVPGDSMAVRSQLAAGWTVEGEIEVTDYQDLGDPDIDVDESAVTETMTATFTLTATDSLGEMILFEQGTFTLEVNKRKFRNSLD